MQIPLRSTTIAQMNADGVAGGDGGNVGGPDVVTCAGGAGGVFTSAPQPDARAVSTKHAPAVNRRSNQCINIRSFILPPPEMLGNAL